MKQQPSAMPMMVDAVDLQMVFGLPSSAGPLLSELKLRGKAGLPFMKKRFRVVIGFGEVELKQP